MRTRISHQPKLVASSSDDTTIQDLCRFNRRQSHKQKTVKSYILSCWGLKKTISKAEYDDCVSKGLTDLVKVEYV